MTQVSTGPPDQLENERKYVEAGMDHMRDCRKMWQNLEVDITAGPVVVWVTASSKDAVIDLESELVKRLVSVVHTGLRFCDVPARKTNMRRADPLLRKRRCSESEKFVGAEGMSS